MGRHADRDTVSTAPTNPEHARSWWGGSRRKQTVGLNLSARQLQQLAEDRATHEPLPASSGSGADGHLLMRWHDWATALWKQYGNQLLQREEDMEQWAHDNGCPPAEPTAVELLDTMPSRFALFADRTPVPTFPYPRNLITVPLSTTGKLDVSLADYNRFAYHLQDNRKPVTRLQPTTIAKAPFPLSGSFVLTPRTTVPVSMWENVAGPLTATGYPPLDRHFALYTRHPEWACSALGQGKLMEWIVRWKHIRIMADRETLVALHLPHWCPTDQLLDLAKLSLAVSRAAYRAKKEFLAY